MLAAQPPIFIVGANRSGTTLLRLILNAHSRLAIPDELVYFNADFNRTAFTPWYQPSLSNNEYIRFVEDFLRRNQEILAPISVEKVKNDILSASTHDLRCPFVMALQAWADHHGKARWGEKTPGNLFYVDIIYDMFPDARFIYLMRDPRAGVHSMNKSTLFAHDTVINALNRRKYMGIGLAKLRKAVPKEQRLLLKYETLVSEPVSTIHHLCQFLNEDFEPQMLSFHQDAQRYMKSRAVHQFNQAATQPIDKSKVDEWKSNLSDEDIALIEWICQDAMQKHGYRPTGIRLSRSARRIAILKMVYWKFQCWRHRHSPQYILQDQVLARSRNRISRFINI